MIEVGSGTRNHASSPDPEGNVLYFKTNNFTWLLLIFIIFIFLVHVYRFHMQFSGWSWCHPTNHPTLHPHNGLPFPHEQDPLGEFDRGGGRGRGPGCHDDDASGCRGNSRGCRGIKKAVAIALSKFGYRVAVVTQAVAIATSEFSFFFLFSRMMLRYWRGVSWWESC